MLRKLQHKNHDSVLFDDMSWPLKNGKEHNESLEWVLRYGKPTESDIQAAASFIHAYHALIFKTQKNRNHICKTLQEAYNQ